MRTSHTDPRSHQHRIGRRKSRQHVARNEKSQHPEHQPPTLHPRYREHQWQRNQRHDPGIDRNQQSGPSLGNPEIGRDVAQQADGNKLRRIEHESTTHQHDNRQPLPQGDTAAGPSVSLQHSQLLKAVNTENTGCRPDKAPPLTDPVCGFVPAAATDGHKRISDRSGAKLRHPVRTESDPPPRKGDSGTVRCG